MSIRDGEEEDAVRTRVCTVYIVNERIGSPTF